MELVPYPVSFNFLHHAHEFSYSFTIVEYESVWITEKTRKKDHFDGQIGRDFFMELLESVQLLC